MKQLFAVKDVKSGQYGPLMAYGHEAVAIREFGEAAKDPKSMLYRYPEEYQLVHLGEFNDDEFNAAGLGPVIGAVPRVICSAATLRAAAGPEQLSLVKEA